MALALVIALRLKAALELSEADLPDSRSSGYAQLGQTPAVRAFSATLVDFLAH